MQIKNLDALEWMDVASTSFKAVTGAVTGYAIQGAGRPYANASASGVAIAGAKAKSSVSGYTASYQVSAAAAAAAGGAATVNGPVAVLVGVSISY
jgi:hypothetical protein